ncbi:MAG: divergent polysaccharide deacetylase family protein [Thermodesulfobacteriota bacterium]|nr:divergent polysaccharide deacetylase family protein [Thermodesulfobacteriota bacterium]
MLFLTYKRAPEVKIEKKVKDRETPQKIPAPIVKKDRIALIMDDLGYNLSVAHEVLDLDVPVTFSILPMLPYSKKVAQLANERGREILLHIPMEPHYRAGVRNEKNTLMLTMNDRELTEILKKAIHSVPYISGANNHMGSKFTENWGKMGVVLSTIKDYNLFFVDSMTSLKSVGYKRAKNLGLRTAKADIFLDRDSDSKEIKRYFRIAERISRKKGHAIAIAHPRRVTIKVLQEMIPVLQEEGIEFVSVSQLVN